MSEPVLTGAEGFTDAVTFAFADPDAGFFGLARAGVASGPEGLQGSALAVLFAGREPVGVVAEGGLALDADADWDELRLPGHGRAHARAARALAGRRRHARRQRASTSSSRPCRRRRSSPRTTRRRARAAWPATSASATSPARRRAARSTASGSADAPGAPPTGAGSRSRARVSAWLEDGTSLTVAAVRPAGAENHADEATWGALLDAEGTIALADPRVSTTYDGDGHQRRAGLELWVGEEDDYPRRGAGQVLCGSSVELGSCGSTARSSSGSSTAARASGATTWSAGPSAPSASSRASS